LFLGLKLPVELSGINLGDGAYQNISEVKERYKNSTLSKEHKNDISEKLDRLAIDQKYYQTPNLTIKHLSQKLDIHSKFLSQVINETHNQNFCDYINTLRIEEAKSLLKDKETDYKTILEVCYEVGFNSKSTFYEVFKKQTGLTPTAFRKGVNS
jgi:YesN/AraC family two-component response regulator